MHDPGLSSHEMARLFGPEGRVQALLETEAALAESQAELGLIPEAAARAIVSASRSLQVDAGTLLARGWEEGTPLIPLLDLIGDDLPAEHRDHLHWETTTQDIVDTALAWRASRAVQVLMRDLIDTGTRCSRLADEHRHTWMTGRSFLQAARPTTFGARAALWLDSVSGRLRDLHAAAAGLRVQLGGPVGLGSGMGGRSREVASLIGERLGLASGEVPWQSDREPVVSLGATVAGVARTSEKIAGDLMVLAQTEVGEIAMRPGGSTAMSHKANPVDAMRAVSAARLAVAAAAGLLTTPPPRLERDAGGWQVEWHLISEVFAAAAVSVEAVNRALATIEVDASRMEANLDRSLGSDRPEPAEIDRLVAAATSGFEKIRSNLASAG
jgi:3-carboxy-cis,cis-muconate cycloisomerase